jgi:hypothetical protein
MNDDDADAGALQPDEILERGVTRAQGAAADLDDDYSRLCIHC